MSLYDLQRERILDLTFHFPAQRPGAAYRVEPVARELLDHFVIHLRCDLTYGHALNQFVEEDACYLPYVIFLQAVEHDHNTITLSMRFEKLQLEELFHFAQYPRSLLGALAEVPRKPPLTYWF